MKVKRQEKIPVTETSVVVEICPLLYFLILVKSMELPVLLLRSLFLSNIVGVIQVKCKSSVGNETTDFFTGVTVRPRVQIKGQNLVSN